MAFVPIFAPNEMDPHNVYLNLRPHTQWLHQLTAPLNPYPQLSVPFFVNTLSLSPNDSVGRGYYPDFFFPSLLPTAPTANTTAAATTAATAPAPVTPATATTATTNATAATAAAVAPTTTTAATTTATITTAPSLPLPSLPLPSLPLPPTTASTIVGDKGITCMNIDASDSFMKNATNSTQNSPVVIVLPPNIESQSQSQAQSQSFNNGVTRPVDAPQKYLFDSNPPLFWPHSGFAPVSLAPNTFTNDDSNNNKSSTNGNIARIIVVENNDKSNDSLMHNVNNTNKNFEPFPMPVALKNMTDNNTAVNETKENNNPIPMSLPMPLPMPAIDLTNIIQDNKAEFEKKDLQSSEVGSVQPSQSQGPSIVAEQQNFVPTGSSSAHSSNISGRNNAGVNAPRKYGCKECDRVFNNRHNLSHHMRYHRNDRRFKCEDCSKAFFQKIHLIEHRRIHTGEKPHECPACKRRFRHSTNLKRHVKSIHLNEHFQCHSCAQSFKRKATLKRHMLKVHAEAE